MVRWVPVVGAADVPEAEITAAEADGVGIILVNVAGDIVAYEDRCPHEEARLSEGELDLEEGVLVCSRHFWEFDVRTGQRISLVPMHQRNLTVYPVRISGGAVEIDVDGAYKPEPPA